MAIRKLWLDLVGLAFDKNLHYLKAQAVRFSGSSHHKGEYSDQIRKFTVFQK